MARPPDGTTAAPLSRTAILATIAARAAGRKDGERQEFFDEHGLNVGQRDANRALVLRRRAGAEDALDPDADPDERGWLWDAFGVHVAKLGFDLIVSWVPRPSHPGPREDQARLLEALRATPGVIELHDCFDDTIVVMALVRGSTAKGRLQQRLNELSPSVLWAEVRLTDHAQPARGWLDAAVTMAREERRLLNGPRVRAGSGAVTPASSPRARR